MKEACLCLAVAAHVVAFGARPLDQPRDQPHLVFSMVDDMGYNDFYTSTDLADKWPRVSALAESGLAIPTYYTQPMCTPSRASLMTGRWPVRLGLQHQVISGFKDMGLPLSEVTLPDKLRLQGYRNYAVGKWHLGQFSFAHTPTFRGFDEFMGYWTGAIDHYTHEHLRLLDLHEQRAGTDSAPPYHRAIQSQNYSTSIFEAAAKRYISSHAQDYPHRPMFLYLQWSMVHVPLQADDAALAACMAHGAARQRLCAMAATVDAAVGSVYDALVDELGEERLTLMVLAGDNGGVLGPGGGSNYPLRGAKVSLWEGGVRNHALLWGSMLPPAARGKVYTGGLIHHVDMHATLAALAGVPAETSLDGLDVWPALSSLGASPRTSLLHNFDPCVFEPHNHTDGLQDCPAATFAYRLGEWKLVVGQVDASRQIGPNPGAASLLLGAEPEPAQESEEVFSSDFNLYGSFLFQLPSSSLESVLLGSHVRLLPEGAIWTNRVPSPLPRRLHLPLPHLHGPQRARESRRGAPRPRAGDCKRGPSRHLWRVPEPLQLAGSHRRPAPGRALVFAEQPERAVHLPRAQHVVPMGAVGPAFRLGPYTAVCTAVQ